ncbi:MAG: hypothetical protein R3F48_15765 [Candidatus Zixiibacteriota bacterium]
MARRRVYKKRGMNLRKRLLPESNYLRIVMLSLVIVALSSSYIYLRVWVRALDDEIKVLKEDNERIDKYLSSLKTDWVAASSLTGVEQSLEHFKLALQPTLPTQNFVIRPEMIQDDNRYAGLLKALEKIKGNIPVITSSEAEANQLFED